ncbi:glycosyltransferase [Flavobacterium sp.]|uniref:glycosyltransferase n=1 Tax=Flavobacterium sp. TaxID=239 RepID=UPI002CD876EC|nr:glycosyltransferase [Flavobacterium sp.]HSD06766.1 glycosyltransferase [Flavobacterium sp.]
MGLLKSVKRYFAKKNILEKQLDHSIPNYNTYNPLCKSIVFISRAMPAPDKDSGSNRLKETILAFKELGYNCIICSKDTYRTNEYVKYFSDLGVIVYVETNQYRNYFSFLKSIQKVDYVWFYAPESLKKNLSKISRILPKSKTIFDMVDIHFLRFQRAFELEPTQISLKKKQKEYFEIETKLAQKVDYIITISDVEKEIMTQYFNADKLITISNIHYPKINKEQTLPFENREDLLFIGSIHAPNIDAINYLCNEIMPIVWEKLPQVKVNIIGNVNSKIVDLKNPNFVYHGYVPDIEPFFITNKIMVAPLRYGAGVKGKIGQAFEYYLPVVTSSIGAEGMKLINRKNALIDDSKDGFAAAIIELYTNKNLWLELQNNSEKSLEPFSKGILKQTLLSFLE